MGKFMRKSKLPHVPMEVSKSTLGGVRTRAKTLALQRLQSQDCYLQLRSRRLHKTTFFSEPKKQAQRPKQKPTQTPPLGLNTEDFGDVNEVQVQDQFGENNLDFQPIQRASRESTPSNLMIDVDNISTPASSTNCPSLTADNERPRSSILTNIPSTSEVDDLFSHFEQQQQRFFMEKYNFDIFNDIPLPGRYEWVKVNP